YLRRHLPKFSSLSSPASHPMWTDRWPGSAALFLPLAPSQPDHERVERGQSDEPGGWEERDPVELVHDEDDQSNYEPRVRPQLVAQQGSDEDDLDDAVNEQIGGGEPDCRSGQAITEMQHAGRDQVVRVLREFVL